MPDAGVRGLVTISLVTYRPGAWLAPCLASLYEQTYPNIEIRIIDNGGDAETASALRTLTAGRPDVSTVVSDENLGFARAHNRAIASARGEFVCLVNQDMVLDSNFVASAVAAFGDPRVGAVQGRLRWLTPDGERTQRIDSTGLVMSRSRRVTSRGQGSLDGRENDAPGPVFGADGACPVYRRAALEDVIVHVGARGEYFDEDFFMYKEDVDLAWRLRLRGWETRYAPDAVAWHARGAGESAAKTPWEIVRHRRKIPSWVKRLSWRNHRLMQVKNEDIGMVVRDGPRLVLHELAALAYLLGSNPANAAAIFDLVRLLPAAMRKRRAIQRSRVIDRDALATWIG